MSNYIYYNNQLYHHGILGQKWGVRRFQNPDGSLTSAGRERYGSGTIRRAQDRADRAKSEAKTAHILADKYTNAMDRKAAKRQAQADSKKFYFRKRRAQDRADRAKSEAESAHKLANKYTNAMDRKAEKRQSKVDFYKSKEGQEKLKLRDEKIKKAAKIGLAIAGAALVAYGTYKAVDFINNKKATKAGLNAYNQTVKDRKMLAGLVENAKKLRTGPNASYKQSYRVGGQSYKWVNYRNHPELVPNHLRGSNNPILESARFEGKTPQEAYRDAYNSIRFKKKRIS